LITRRRKLWPKGRSYANENMSRWKRLGYFFHDGAEVLVVVNTMEREGRATMVGEKPGGG